MQVIIGSLSRFISKTFWFLESLICARILQGVNGVLTNFLMNTSVAANPVIRLEGLSSNSYIFVPFLDRISM